MIRASMTTPSTVLKHVDGVAVMEGLLQQSIEWRLSPDDPWQPARPERTQRL